MLGIPPHAFLEPLEGEIGEGGRRDVFLDLPDGVG